LAALCFTLIDLFGEGNTVCIGFAVIVSSSLEVDSSTPTSKKNQFTCYFVNKIGKFDESRLTYQKLQKPNRLGKQTIL
jgi:hypothetical protein